MKANARSGRALRVTADPRTVSMADAIRNAAHMAPLFIVTGRAFDDLAGQVGGHEEAAAFLLDLAESVGRPIAVNVVTGRDMSSTAFISPRNWTTERLAGWVAGHHELLESQFGDVARVERK